MNLILIPLFSYTLLDMHWSGSDIWVPIWAWAVVVLVLITIIALVIGYRHRRSDSDDAMELLRERYARGELSNEEFEERAARITSEHDR